MRIAIAVILLTTLPLAACAPPSRLTLMTFNIRYANPGDGVNAWDRRREVVAEVIEDARPDVLGVQEALHAQLLDLEGRLPAWAWVGVGRDDGAEAGEFAPIFYRPEAVRLIESGTFWFSDTPDQPGSRSYGNEITRICTWARFDTVRGARTLLVANVHLDHQSAESRLASMRQLRRWIAERAQGDPVFVLGDFNCTPESEPMRIMLDDGWQTAGASGAASGTYHAFTGQARSRIDMILVPGGMRVLDAAVISRGGDGGVWPSDHHPVRARLAID
jgi:endonuclease/exonuclease/phosphatase family metal-dependent hydrolase